MTGGDERLLRPMRNQDAAAADRVMQAALADKARSRGEQPPPADPARQDRMIAVLRHFIAADPAGCWVAERDAEILGMAVAIRRQQFWGLGLLFIVPEAQRLGIGRNLLQACARYAEGCSCKMIMSSTDPRSMRTYAMHGLDVHPAMTATGVVDPSALRAKARVREGSTSDLPLVGELDTIVRGSSRARDVEFVLSQGARLMILDAQTERGYAVHAPGLPVVGGHPMMLSATSEAAAETLLRQVLSIAEDPVDLFGLTRRQGWAIRIALEARLTVRPGPPLCVSPGCEPPGPWLLSGVYF